MASVLPGRQAVEVLTERVRSLEGRSLWLEERVHSLNEALRRIQCWVDQQSGMRSDGE